MDLFSVCLVIATLLCALVAGFLFAFAVVVMPGLRRLPDAEFLAAFCAMDGVIQRNQPLFMVVWVGSIPALVAAAVLGYGELEGAARWMLVAAAALYLLGVQAPTFVINVPLNNQLQRLDFAKIDAAGCHSARLGFERRWNRSNVARTVAAVVVAGLLLGVLPLA